MVKFLGNNYIVFVLLVCYTGAIGQDFVKGRLILQYDQKSSSLQKLVLDEVNTLNVDMRKSIGFDKFELIEFDPLFNTDSLIRVFSGMGIAASKDYIIPFAGASTILTNDLYNDMGYWNSANSSTLPAKNNMDSVLAFMPPLYQNNADDPGEKVLFIHTEIPRLSHADLPTIDLQRSIDFYRGGTPIADSNATPHGSWTAGCGFAKWNNAGVPVGFNGGMTGMTNNRRPIILNIANADYGTSSAGISMLNWCYNYCQTYPDRRLVISFSFGGSYFPEDIGNLIDDQDQILLMHGAGNDNMPGYNLRNKFQLSVMATDPNGRKATFSNYGQYIDIAFQGSSMKGLSPSDDFLIDQWQGTSASAPAAAGLAVTLWNLMPEKSASEIKALLKDKRNTTWMVAQPDSTESKPSLRLWYLLGNIIFPLQEKFSVPIDAKEHPVIDLDTIVNDLINTQANRKFFWLTKSGWREIKDGKFGLDEMGSGKRYIMYKWTNSKSFDLSGLPTESELVRMIEVFNTKPIVTDSLNYCSGASSYGIKIMNMPDKESLDTFRIFLDGVNVPGSFNPVDSSLLFSTMSKNAFELRIEYFRKDDSLHYRHSSFFVESTPIFSNLLGVVSYDSIAACSGSIATFFASSNAKSISHRWIKNGDLAQLGSTSFTDSALVSGDVIKCEMAPFSGCWDASTISRSIVVNVPDCIDNFNYQSIGSTNACEYSDNACDGQISFLRRSSSDVSQNSYLTFSKKMIPTYGTIEFMLTVSGGSTSIGTSSTSATIFAIQNGSYDWSGSGCFVSVSSTGNITFRQYGLNGGFTTLTAASTPFRFNQKNIIGISFGKLGMKISVNGVVRASNTISMAMNKGTGILGGIVDQLFGGNLWYLFTGTVDKVRISYKENDFKLTNLCTNYVFTGDGNWENSQNWRGGIKPPGNLPNGSEIQINPISGGKAIMGTEVKIENGAVIKVIKGGKLILPGNLIIRK